MHGACDIIIILHSRSSLFTAIALNMLATLANVSKKVLTGSAMKKSAGTYNYKANQPCTLVESVM